MKQLFTFSILAVTCYLTQLHAQGTFCDTTSNVIIFSNYDGGILNIDVDQNIPNLKIGVVSYEAVQINISGTYAGNVTKVWYAGYNGTNDNCNLGVTNTTISGVPANVDTIQITPAATYTDPNGYMYMDCAYQCTGGNQGGCNTPEQVVHFFLTKFGETTFRFHRTHYNCWPAGSIAISAGGNCCLAAIPTAVEVPSSAANFTLFPNPSCGNTTLNFVSAGNEDAAITVFDATGKAVLTKTVFASEGQNAVILETENFASGIYLVQVNTAAGVASQKLEVE